MTEKNNNNNNNLFNWRTNQIWIKDVLSKSGTELMEISSTNLTETTTTTTTQHEDNDENSYLFLLPSTSKAAALLNKRTVATKNGVGKKNAKKTNAQELPSKMVYYQSTPLIVKTEQPSHAQFCTPLRAATSTTTLSTTTLPSPSPTVTLIPGTVFSNFHQQLLPLHAQQQGMPTVVDISTQQTQQQSQSQTTSITLTNNNENQQEQNYLLTHIKQEQLPPSITLYATTSTAQPVQHITTTTTTTATTKTNSTRKNNNAGRPKPQFKCEQCGMIFGSKSAHTSHVKSHAKTVELPSTSTNSQSAATSTIELNEAGMPLGIPKMPQITPNDIGGSDPYQCNVCQKTFAVPARLIRHYRTHTGERPFECEFCHKLFSVKENLQVHRRIHTKERPYKCDVCGRAFEHSGKLHRHMRIHTGERPHKCSVCEKTFIQSGQLVIHMRTHTGEKPYKCPVEGCGKGFTCSKQLKVHSRTHTGEKPYHCDICMRDFGYNHVLKLHRVQHYGSKCYKCTICDNTFKNKKEMEAHIKGHANEMPDDDETSANATTAGVANSEPTQCSTSSSSGEATTSAPASPQSPNSCTITVAQSKIRKPRQPRTTPRVVNAVKAANLSPPSPSSPSSTYSPPSSSASASRLSASSPLLAPVSNYAEATIETDLQYNSHDSGVSINFNAPNNNSHPLELHHMPVSSSQSYANGEELPTDLSKTTTTTANYYQNTNTSTYGYLHQHSPVSQKIFTEEPTINPALLEAATIASEEEVTKAALQIMQLQRNSATSNLQVQPVIYKMQYESQYDSAHQDEDTRETNELIERYKRGELASHGLHKRYAPVPKFESSLLNNEIIVRQVEAAIGPLRSSTESPERSSSPESDSLMLVDRDVMTLPLRKRKLYMNGEHEEHEALALNSNRKNVSNSNESAITNQKIMRSHPMSVIQFAKAS